MSLLLNRSLFYLTLASYLLVGSIGVRLFTSEAQFSVVLPSLSLLNQLPAPIVSFSLDTPELEFDKVVLPAPVKRVAAKTPERAVRYMPASPDIKLKTVKLSKHELPFTEPFKLRAVSFQRPLKTNFIALFNELSTSLPETLIADKSVELLSDEVTVSQANVQGAEVEPDFFDYSEQSSADSNSENEIFNAAQISDVHHLNKLKKLAADQSTRPVEATEKVGIDEIMNLGYSGTGKAIPTQAPQVSRLNMPQVQKSTHAGHSSSPKRLEQENEGPSGHISEEGNEGQNGFLPEEESSSPAFAALDIQLVGSDLKSLEVLRGFELIFQDDYSELRDNEGTIELRESLSHVLMTRSVKVLKTDFAPTNTDLIFQETQKPRPVSLPVIAQDTFSELLGEFQKRGPIGAVLVELADETEAVSLDVPYGRKYNLDKDFKVTERADFRYALFVGVQAGNAVLTYLRNDDKVIKVVHVHKWELTFDSNYYEKDPTPTVSLYEEDLLAKERAPLIIAADQVRAFISYNPSTKISDHAYRVDSGRLALGARKYLELTHLEETIFVGVGGNAQVAVPSENFMRFILSRFEGAQLGDRCMIQVNLSKRAVGFAVGSESTTGALMTYAQMLDADGKFYDSIGEKTKKIIILGENQGSPGLNPNSKVNIKISYSDGTEQYLGAFCSPNTYFVEQL